MPVEIDVEQLQEVGLLHLAEDGQQLLDLHRAALPEHIQNPCLDLLPRDASCNALRTLTPHTLTQLLVNAAHGRGRSRFQNALLTRYIAG